MTVAAALYSNKCYANFFLHTNAYKFKSMFVFIETFKGLNLALSTSSKLERNKIETTSLYLI